MMVRIHVPEKAFLERAISYPHYFPLKATSLLAWSFLFPFINLFSWWYGFTFQKKHFWKEQFPTRITSLLRPPLYNGHFPLFKVAAIERLDCTSIINRMLNGLFCKTGHHFTVKLHEIKHGFLPKIAGLDFPDLSNSWLVKLVELNVFWWNS